MRHWRTINRKNGTCCVNVGHSLPSFSCSWTHGRLRAVEVHFPFFDFFPSILSPVSLLPPSPFSSYFTVTSVRKPQGRDRPGGCWASLCSEHSALRWKLMSTWTSPFHQLMTAIPFNPTDAAVPLLPKYPPLRAFLIGFVSGGG